MTTTVVNKQRGKLSFQSLGLAIGAFAAVVAVAAFAQNWGRESGAESPLVAQQNAAFLEHEALIGQALAASEVGPSVAEIVSQAVAEHSAAFPLPPSIGAFRGGLTAEDAIAEHDALIDAWLSHGG